MIRFWGGAFVIAASLAGCTPDDGGAPSVFPTEPTSAVPSEIEDLLAAAQVQDVEGVRAHLTLWNYADGVWVVGDDVPLACVEGQIAEIAHELPANTFVSDYLLADGDLAKTLWFERSPDARVGWALRQLERQWYLEAQSQACLDTVFDPSPSPNP